MPNTNPSFSAGPAVAYGSGLTRVGPNNTPISIDFTPLDAEQTGAGAIAYTVRTAPAGGGTLVGSGTCTSGTPKSHSLAYNATGLVVGSNTLYVRLDDGAGGSNEAAVTVLRDDGVPTGVAVLFYGGG